MYAHQCEKCGAFLDPGERCDCEANAERERQLWEKRMAELFVLEKETNQFCFNFYKREGGA